MLNPNKFNFKSYRLAGTILVLFTLLAACSSGSPNSSEPNIDNNTPREPQTFLVEPGPAPDGEAAALEAFFLAQEGDVIQFEAGTFDLTTTLIMAHKNGIVIRGRGQDQTILNFENSDAPEGISMSHMDGITVEDLTIVDTPGFSIKISDSDHIVLQNMRAMWTSGDGGQDANVPSTLDVSCEHALSTETSTGFYTNAAGAPNQVYQIDSSNGGYAIYPVKSNNILLDNVTALGASDAGIYVGQSNDVIVKNSLARFNVAGYEIENTDRADMFDNLADCNTGGFLIFDLPGLSQYGDQTRTFRNESLFNNTPNFAPGGIVGAVPQGTGMLALGYDEMEFFNNRIEGNRTGGIILASHELLDGCITKTNNNGDTVPCTSDIKMDLYPEAWHIHNNTFTNNGYLPQPPSSDAFTCEANTGPGLDDVPPCIINGVDDSHPSLLPALVLAKGAQSGNPRGAHIIWDGHFAEQPFASDNSEGAPNDCPYPTGVDEDHKGKPQYKTLDTPQCRFNGYKFERDNAGNYVTDNGAFKRLDPQFWGCIESNNNFDTTSAPAFMNFKNTDPTSPADFDISEHDCPAKFNGQDLQPLPEAVVETYQIQAGGDASLSDEEVLAICENFSGTTINADALPYNCPKLSHYNLFQDATDPRVNPNGGGLLYDLTTPLFSDYASKYRYAFIPQGEAAQWVEGDANTPNHNLEFPVGTVIAKTFTFKDGNNENVVETRLLIHRQGEGVEQSDSSNFWEGFSYIWEKDANGNLVDADIAITGGTADVTWNFTDPDTGTATAGSTDKYSIPHPNQCGTCHANDDRPGGDAPIGMKVRLMNRQLDYNGSLENQLQHWIDAGKLVGAPALTLDADNNATNVNRLPNFQIPNDLAIIDQHPNNVQTPGSADYDIEIRARAWLETNCAHCHNRRGIASSTGLFLDTFRAININYGICKTPTTAGSSSGGRTVDIEPGNDQNSIVSFRVHSDDPSAQMPPVARSVTHAEAAALLDQWINDVVNDNYADAGCGAPF